MSHQENNLLHRKQHGAVNGWLLSPLRYPGAKRWLADYITDAIRLNNLKPEVFVEPFAGGAGVSLQLLSNGVVNKIALGERDPLVASFWKVVFWDASWLTEQIGRIDVTLDRWKEMRRSKPRSDRQRALKCLFLNRTSFSGILANTAGPIGGQTQQSRYKIDCRFYRDTLTARIEQAHALRDKVFFVENCTWQETISKVRHAGFANDRVFYYLDPPFYNKADRLYRYCFTEEDHRTLHDALDGIDQPWLLSYDLHEHITRLYSNNGTGPRKISQLYSIAAGSGPRMSQELIISNLGALPQPQS